LSESRVIAAIREPLQGKTSLSKVVWVYGLLGSLAVSAIGLLIDSGNGFAMHAYTAFGLLFSIYVTIATYRCAGNCRSALLARFVRISAIVTLLALPVFAYLEFTGALDLSAITLRGEE
jgi:succinate-acetate transporter protein